MSRASERLESTQLLNISSTCTWNISHYSLLPKHFLEMREKHECPLKYSFSLSREQRRSCKCTNVRGAKCHRFSLEGRKQSEIFSRERLPEHVHAPAGHGREEARPQVSSRVDGVAAVQAHGHSDGHDGQADAQRLHTFRGADVLLVSDGQDAQDERSSSNDLEKQGGGGTTA